MIRFTKHAEDKFHLLLRHRVHITHEQVTDAIERPDRMDYSRLPLLIAQVNIDRAHVLRVVYKITPDGITVITFYPGRKKQYE